MFNYHLIFSLQTDRAAMLDEIVDYVKFLRLQVKVNDIVFFLRIYLVIIPDCRLLNDYTPFF